MKSQDGICRIIEIWRKVVSRPKLFIWTIDNILNAQLYIAGFYSACLALGHAYSVEIERSVYSAHGFELRADGVMSQLVDSGMSDQEIVAMLLQLELEKWEATLADCER